MERAKLQVKVTFFGVIRDMVGNSPSVALEVREGCTLKELLGVLCRQYGPDFSANLMRSDGIVQPFVNIVLNGETTDSFHLEVPLNGNIAACQKVDIFIMPAISGGSCSQGNNRPSSATVYHTSRVIS